MHPNTYLRSFWQPEIKNQVFVAMSFEDRFTERFDQIIKPAIEGELISGIQLSAFKVDNSQTGDSILTDIADGIVHSMLFLADVSVIDEGRYAEQPIRNGNVMYEVGLALASRQPSEVLLIRDDTKKFLFDVSTIPHITIDFEDNDTAIQNIRMALTDRITETNKIFNAKVSIATKSLTPLELQILESFEGLNPGMARDFSNKSRGLSIPMERAVSSLLSKGCIESVAKNEETNGLFYGITSFGTNVSLSCKVYLRKVKPDKIENNQDQPNKPLKNDAASGAS